jgi:hypothetical protein
MHISFVLLSRCCSARCAVHGLIRALRKRGSLGSTRKHQRCTRKDINCVSSESSHHGPVQCPPKAFHEMGCSCSKGDHRAYIRGSRQHLCDPARGVVIRRSERAGRRRVNALGKNAATAGSRSSRPCQRITSSHARPLLRRHQRNRAATVADKLCLCPSVQKPHLIASSCRSLSANGKFPSTTKVQIIARTGSADRSQ